MDCPKHCCVTIGTDILLLHVGLAVKLPHAPEGNFPYEAKSILVMTLPGSAHCRLSTDPSGTLPQNGFVLGKGAGKGKVVVVLITVSSPGLIVSMINFKTQYRAVPDPSVQFSMATLGYCGSSNMVWPVSVRVTFNDG